jgi:hypothetical protein
VTVHNHGSEEGEGLACPETRLSDGSLKGRCLMFVSEGINNPGTGMVPKDFQQEAKHLVKDVIDNEIYESGPESVKPVYELYVVWFAKTLQNWKALVSTDMNDGMYFEVTYNGDKGETYVDAYVKMRNIVIPD